MTHSAKGTPITTIALDGRVELRSVKERLRWPEIRRFAYGSLYELDQDGRLWVFGFGAIVQDGAEGLTPGLRQIVEDATGRRFLQETLETYYVATDASQPVQAPRVGWDQVVIPERSPELLGAVALLLGQSVALERYEIAANGLLDEALSLTRRLSEVGLRRRGSTDLARRVGRIISDRLELARWFFFVDRPEDTWENARVATLYDALFGMLELKERHNAMLHKLEAVETATEIVIDLWQGRQSNLLEWTIVLLIGIDILVSLARAG